MINIWPHPVAARPLVLQHPQSFSSKKIKIKNKKLGMELVKYSGFKKKIFKSYENCACCDRSSTPWL